MIALALQEIADIVGGRLVLPADSAADALVDGTVETDSRRVTAGSIFFALPGEVTDGHLFAPAAVDAGAALVVAERDPEVTAPVVVVPDGVAALHALATEIVRRVRSRGRMRVVGITGSNGKTTTKNLLAAALGAHGRTVAPRESFNNHVGAPISMLMIDDDTEYLVVEMGASGIGHIARLAAIARPDIAVVLKVGLAHAGEFGGVEATQRAKSELVQALGADGVAVLNADDPRVAAMSALAPGRVHWFGLSNDAETRADHIAASASGTTFELHAGGTRRTVALRILGEHHVMNALATLAVVSELGVPLEPAVEAIEAVARAERWRMEVLPREDGVVVINDAYNASPDSMAAALKTLAQITPPEGRSFAVLGEMAELGEFADEEHDRLGRLVVRLNISQLIVVGHGARHIHNAAGLEGSWDGESRFVADADAAYAVLRDELRAGDVVLVKSSKSAGLRFLGDRLGGLTP
ncbi:UDP-N-acetylmuramoyl-tripeptide--D-alanyl-D-alanine ligase [Diaminobutyricimonas aerilata]|uniref:UDP-N-acetylmuramoyl-tripeptide--D-alanyl-D-alanine ligase n=1 Tax=Diaminobutyricimonas aerilata TaxID=1162967 RepID=A0A2M9CKG8_9MICO|nr:UDP-N-acetylmuramoyl-tripeptide--D-alanyl-D-alanine ligase [Diaminobutyricimonas aerilata]PJJ72390.1 UDP-N-acetylmuramoyl-tripeptide--D-alanyl-D-alanine ligase [Diaminobutyricimonas aerilata]